jgi:hypothetical protein
MNSAASVGAGRAPAAATVRAERPTSLSQRLWGLEWSKELPWQLDGCTVEHGTFADALPFMGEHYGRIFGWEPDRFHVEQMSEAKRRFGDEMDVFVFRADGKTVGVAAGHPTDWSTYYVRTFALLKEYRDRGWCLEWTERIGEPLRRVGCERWEGECSPANVAMIRMLTSRGCLITGTVNSERWGAMLRFGRLLNDDARAAFTRQFIHAPTGR